MNAPVFISAYRQLTPLEKRFVDLYVNQVERDAAKENERISNALYRPIAPETIEAARGMLDKPMVIAAINERIVEIASASELTVQRIVKEYMNIAFSNMADFMTIDAGGFPEWDLTKCNPDQLAAIKSFELDELPKGGRKIKVVLHDKLAGLRELATYVGMLAPDNPHWRADNARPVAAALPIGSTEADAADAYARLIND